MSSPSELLAAVIENRQQLAPIETDIDAQLPKISGIRAVIFDVYGTLVVSGSGDVGSANDGDKASKIGEAFAAVGWHPPVLDIPQYASLLQSEIKRSNDPRRNENCPKPEVDIVDVWRNVLVAAGLDSLATDSTQCVRFAAEYESRANPTWPMPGASELLGVLRDRKIPLGIVSNAQIFTIPLVEDLTGGDLAETGFDLNLSVFSNRFRQAKPGPRLFQVLCDGLRRLDIAPHEAIYVGNDMLNDVWAARQAGLRTAWFAGDRRSCRPRDDDPRCQSLRPDIVLTDLLQLPDCLLID